MEITIRETAWQVYMYTAYIVHNIDLRYMYVYVCMYILYSIRYIYIYICISQRRIRVHIVHTCTLYDVHNIDLRYMYV